MAAIRPAASTSRFGHGRARSPTPPSVPTGSGSRRLHRSAATIRCWRRCPGLWLPVRATASCQLGRKGPQDGDSGLGDRVKPAAAFRRDDSNGQDEDIWRRGVECPERRELRTSRLDRALPTRRRPSNVVGMYDLSPARAQCVDRYNALIGRAKASWDWPPGYLNAAIPFLKVTTDYIASSSSFAILCDNRLVGFCALTDEPPGQLLDHLWIEPRHFGKGAGRFAVTEIVNRAKGRQVSWIDVWPDPPSVGFYQSVGFNETGDLAASRVSGGPTFERLRLTVYQ